MKFVGQGVQKLEPEQPDTHTHTHTHTHTDKQTDRQTHTCFSEVSLDRAIFEIFFRNSYLLISHASKLSPLKRKKGKKKRRKRKKREEGG